MCAVKYLLVFRNLQVFGKKRQVGILSQLFEVYAVPFLRGNRLEIVGFEKIEGRGEWCPVPRRCNQQRLLRDILLRLFGFRCHLKGDRKKVFHSWSGKALHL